MMKNSKGYLIGIAILAGGKSTRMGQNKTLLLTDKGVTFLDRMMDEFAGFEYKYLSSNDCREDICKGYSVIRDCYKDIGPMGGIFSVLKQTECDAVLVAAADMPLYNPDEALKIIDIYNGEDILAAKHSDGKYQMLASIYSKGCIERMEEMITAGEYKLMRLMDCVDSKDFIITNEIAYTNINTMADYRQFMCERES